MEKTAAGRPSAPGRRGHRNLRISRARPRRPGGNTASRDQSAADRDKERRSSERNRRSGSRNGGGSGRGPEIGATIPRPRMPRRPREKGGPAMKNPRTTETSQCVTCGGRLRNAVFCPICGHSSCSWACSHAAPRAALDAARAARVLPGRLPSRRAAGPGGRAGVRRLIARTRRPRTAVQRIVGEPEPRGEFVGPEAPGSEEAKHSPHE